MLMIGRRAAKATLAGLGAVATLLGVCCVLPAAGFTLAAGSLVGALALLCKALGLPPFC
jgi:hypothetical protein